MSRQNPAPMFRVAVFITAKNWKKPGSFSAGEQINWCIHVNSAIKRSELQATERHKVTLNTKC